MIDVVNNIVHMRVEEKKQNFSVDIDSSIPKTLIADEQRLAQVITNLLTNAVKFTPENGSIAVTAERIGENNGFCSLRIIVKDSGIGISGEQQKHLFVPFEQADGSISRKFGGTGLGLSISKRIVEMMGGNIWVESELGKGASFILEVEAKIGSGRGVVEESVVESVDDSRVFVGKRILIAEDVDINREIIYALLEETGVVIDFAEDGAEAVQMYVSMPDAYDMILMDIQMPEMDGYEATKRIRQSGEPGAKTIPIVAMTANVFREDIERCIEAGMNGHLGKPIETERVFEVLKKHLLSDTVHR